MGKTKRIIGIFLSLVLVLGVVPMIGLTSKAATYAIRIGDGGSVKVDGKEVDLKYYEAESGSTIITLNGEFTKNLSEGEHVLEW